MPTGYDDTETGPIDSPTSVGDDAAREEDRSVAEQSSAPDRGGVHWPTVMMAGGVAAIISSVIVTIGVVGLLLSDLGDRNTAASAQPTVVNLGSAQAAAPPVAEPAGAPLQSTAAASPSPAPPTAAAPAEGSSADLPAGGGATGGGMLPGAPAAQGVPEAPGTTQQQTTAQQQSAAQQRPTPTAAQLQNDLDTLVGGGSTAQKAQRLEGGARAVRQAQPIVAVLQRFKPLGFTYRVTGPVTVTGNTLKATLELRSPGWNPAQMPLYWVWQGGQWKLSNRSICDIGAYAQIPCSL